MTSTTEFYAKVRERLAASRALMDAAVAAMARNDHEGANDLLHRADQLQDSMLREMHDAYEQGVR